MKFNPTKPGKFAAKIDVLTTALVTEETTLTWHRLPESICLYGQAEIPLIDIQPHDAQILHFGAVTHGMKREQCLTITNNGKSDVPLRLRIASVSTLNQQG